VADSGAVDSGAVDLGVEVVEVVVGRDSGVVGRDSVGIWEVLEGIWEVLEEVSEEVLEMVAWEDRLVRKGILEVVEVQEAEGIHLRVLHS
jgi:hypothetical protein